MYYLGEKQRAGIYTKYAQLFLLNILFMQLILPPVDRKPGVFIYLKFSTWKYEK
jgi:hypothetical protein